MQHGGLSRWCRAAERQARTHSSPRHCSRLGETGQGAAGWELGLGVSTPSHAVIEQVLGEGPRGDFSNHQLSL